MCGIFGIWNRNRQPIDLLKLKSATDLMLHRGPDDSGYLLINTETGRIQSCRGTETDENLNLPDISQFYGESFDLAFGFRRLAILDLSSAGHQPMSSHDGRYWMVFNGEIYNYLELRTELQGFGYTFQSNTDTEVLLTAYQHWGENCLQHFNGMWAFAIWDTQDEKLFLSRDRIGIKPLYWSIDKAQFAFASEIKALAHTELRENITPSAAAIYRYLRYGVLPDNETSDTFYDDISRLVPGHSFTITREQQVQKQFWNLKDHQQSDPSQDPEKIAEGLYDRLNRSVELRLRSDVPVGTSLSGGVDSTSIAALIRQQMLSKGMDNFHHQKTFSSVYDMEGRFNEREFIDIAINKLGPNAHYTIPSIERLTTDIENLVWYQDEPMPSTSMFAQWCVMKKAKENNITVMLDGQGADEMLAGYRPFYVYLQELIRKRKFGQAWQAMEDIQSTIDSKQSRLSMTGSLFLDMLRSSNLMWHLGRTVRGVVNNEEENRGFNPDFELAYKNVPIKKQIYSNLDDYTRSMMISSLPNLLRFEDRNSMAHSIEARVPFLDHNVVEYIVGSAAPWRIHKGWTKWVLRQAMSSSIPKEIAWRKDKVGYETPEELWQQQLSTSMSNRFNANSKVAQYLDYKSVQTTLSTPVSNKNDALQRWRWVNLMLWLDAYKSPSITI